MRIAQLANFYSPLSGGLRTSVDAVGRRYGQAGHERLLVVPGSTDAEEEIEGGRRIEVRSPSIPGAPYRVLLNARRVRAILDEWQPDCVEVSDKLTLWWVGPWARRRGVRSVLWSHERVDAILGNRVPSGFPLPLFADGWNRRVVRGFETVVCASRFAAAEFTRVGVEPQIVPLGVEHARFKPRDRKPHRKVRLALVSRLSSEKRPEIAVAAVRRLRSTGVDAQLDVIGDGPMRSRLQDESAGQPVVFHGHTPADTVAEVLANADVSLAPSPCETFGLAVLESLASGTPVVVSNSGATGELVDDRCARVVDLHPDAFARAAAELVVPTSLDRRAAAHARASAFSWDATAASLLDLHVGRAAPERS